MPARSNSRFLLGLAVAASTALLTAPTAVAAGETGLPGMCTGRSDPLTSLTAHANGTPKYVLNLESDESGHPTGVLVLGRGPGRVYVDDFCRLWQHLPGQLPEGEGHPGEEVDEDATTAHAVGIGSLQDGTRVLVRTDVRENDEGRAFRVRYRVMGAHGEDGTDEAWTRLPVEGWAPLDLFILR